jgi:arsenite methyltransferase
VTDIREEVRQRYAEAAVAATKNTMDAPAFETCCGGSDGCCGEQVFGASLYSMLDGEVVPGTALLASLGCGNPTAVADLKAGETVLDLGSGGGIDVLLSARRVGPTGKAYGLDMTDEMLELARKNQREAGLENVEFIKGYIEDIPLPEASVDVIISNCVINLAADKHAVFAEMKRVLKPGGRLGVTDVVAADELSPEQRAERGSYAGCIAGALSFSEYRAGLEKQGFEEISIEPTHSAADGMFAAIVKAVRA